VNSPKYECKILDIQSPHPVYPKFLPCGSERFAGPRSATLTHRWRSAGSRTRPNHCWPSFTHQSSVPPADHVADSTSIGGSTARRSASVGMLSDRYLDCQCVGTVDGAGGQDGSGSLGLASWISGSQARQGRQSSGGPLLFIFELVDLGQASPPIVFMISSKSVKP
jgi:hypothetical protein